MSFVTSLLRASESCWAGSCAINGDKNNKDIKHTIYFFINDYILCKYIKNYDCCHTFALWILLKVL
ncbi:MAG: hypothetical protein HUJ92_05145 [Bacteroidales bacterium]|nr:hypothetical protein [Bacteroidales bacterium]